MTKKERAKAYMTKRFIRQPQHEDVIISCMIEFSDLEKTSITKKANNYEGAYNGLKFKFDQQLKENKAKDEEILSLNIFKKSLNKIIVTQLKEITQLKEALESKGKEVEELRGKVNKPYG